MAFSFRVGRIPVQVVPAFFVTTVVFGAYGMTDLAHVAAWAVIVFVSVLAHELGHALAGVAFGLQPSIQIHGLGGTTSWQGPKLLPVARRVVISLAGPVAGFALGGLVIAIGHALGPGATAGALAAFTYGSLLWVNIGWGALNLLPILPLDGGAVLFQLLDASTHGHGERPARIVSIVVAVAGAALSAIARQPFPAVFAATFAVMNWRALRALDAPPDAPNVPTG